MNARGLLVAFILGGFAILGLSSLTPRANPTASDRFACNTNGYCAYVPGHLAGSNAQAFYAVRERRDERLNF